MEDKVLVLYWPTTTAMFAAMRLKVQWAAVITQLAAISVAPQYWLPPPDWLMSASKACQGHSVTPAVCPPTIRVYKVKTPILTINHDLN